VDLVEDNVARDVGVDGLEDLDDVKVEQPVGVAGRDAEPPGVTGLDPGLPDDEGLCIPEPEEVNPTNADSCFGTKLLFTVVSVWEFANCSNI